MYSQIITILAGCWKSHYLRKNLKPYLFEGQFSKNAIFQQPARIFCFFSVNFYVQFISKNPVRWLQLINEITGLNQNLLATTSKHSHRACVSRSYGPAIRTLEEDPPDLMSEPTQRQASRLLARGHN